MTLCIGSYQVTFENETNCAKANYVKNALKGLEDLKSEEFGMYFFVKVWFKIQRIKNVELSKVRFLIFTCKIQGITSDVFSSLN